MDPRRWDQLTVLHAQVEHEIGRTLQRGHDLGLSEYRALCHLSTAPDGELRMQDLAARLGLNQSSVSRLAARLESAGLTYRDLCAGDRRGVYLVISEPGRARQAEAVGTYAEALAAALAGAAVDPALTPLVEALAK